MNNCYARTRSKQ